MISSFKLGGSKKPKAPAPIVWINGYPGVGRHGVAIELTRLFPEGTVEVVHNTDSCALADGDDEEHNDDCRGARSATTTDYVVCEDEADKTIVIIESLIDDKHGSQAANDYRTAARVADRPFLPIYLVCDAAEHLVRVRARNAEPAIKYQGKPPAEKAVVDILMTAPLFRFEDPKGRSVDITRLSAAQAARVIWGHVQDFESGLRVERGEGDDDEYMLINRGSGRGSLD